MSKPGKQLPLQLPLQAANARDDLVVTPANHNAVAYIDSWPDWPGPVTILAGPVGAGKSHLAEIWAAKTNAICLKASLGDDAVGDDDGVLQTGNFVVEGLAQGAFSEVWLFHLINSVRSTRGSLLLTSRRFPTAWGVALPDLISRLKTAQLIELNEPDDMLLSGVLVKLFSDRQLLVEADVVEYLVQRMERSLASAQKLVELIDQMSLVEKRAVTKPLAGQVLKSLGLRN